jgi:two-component SAPR family response regulator
MNKDSPPRRILVVEDETAIAMIFEEVLRDAGFEVVGPVSKLATAISLAREEALDAAVLDVTIRGGAVYPVADILKQRNVPFVLASGYEEWALPDAYRGLPRLSKPFTPEDIDRMLAQLFPPLRTKDERELSSLER